jgi:hypothetical protein
MPGDGDEEEETEEEERGGPTKFTIDSTIPGVEAIQATPPLTPAVCTSTASTRPTTPKKPPSEQKLHQCPHVGCAKAFNRPARLAEHLRSHTNERPFKCAAAGCAKSFLRQAHLAHHTKSAHLGVREYVCSVARCGKRFVTGTRLRRHEATHAGRSRFQCTAGCGEQGVCGAVFRKHSTLQRHIRDAHLHQKPFVCGHVDDAVAALGAESSAVTSELELGPGLRSEPTMTTTTTTTTMTTTTPCTEAFDTAAQLRRHQRSAHSGPRFWCSECADSAPAAGAALEGDENGGAHTLPLITSIDGDSGVSENSQGQGVSGVSASPARWDYVFETYAQLQLHLQTVHPPVCGFCHRICASQRQLRQHIELEHPEPVPLADDDGDGVATDENQNPAGVTASATTAAAAERPSQLLHPCDVDGCGRVFTRRHNLKVHKRTVHEGVKPFVCSAATDLRASKKVAGWSGEGACQRAFQTKGNLEEHIRTQHMGLPGAARPQKQKQQDRQQWEGDAGARVPFTAVSAIDKLTGVGLDMYADMRAYGDDDDGVDGGNGDSDGYGDDEQLPWLFPPAV